MSDWLLVKQSEFSPENLSEFSPENSSEFSFEIIHKFKRDEIPEIQGFMFKYFIFDNCLGVSLFAITRSVMIMISKIRDTKWIDSDKKETLEKYEKFLKQLFELNVREEERKNVFLVNDNENKNFNKKYKDDGFVWINDNQ